MFVEAFVGLASPRCSFVNAMLTHKAALLEAAALSASAIVEIYVHLDVICLSLMP
jgi:hypothetical protein